MDYFNVSRNFAKFWQKARPKVLILASDQWVNFVYSKMLIILATPFLLYYMIKQT